MSVRKNRKTMDYSGSSFDSFLEQGKWTCVPPRAADEYS
jgi:hypothetical protein